jgi:4-amino-4-deoxy-L-arabinose transferase-like glycosyltransferase
MSAASVVGAPAPAPAPGTGWPSLSGRAFVALVAGVTGAKLWLATRLPLLGDEAFYWLESGQPALAYTDVPGLTPWLIAVGTGLFGDTPVGVRAPFLLLGGLLPLLVAAWARRFVDAGSARVVGAASLAVPLAGSLGLLALPDVPLTLVIVALALALDRYAERGRTTDALVLGMLIALGWLAHYRFVVAAVPAAAWLLVTPRGRRVAREPRFWLALAVGLAGLLPTIAFNAQHDWQGFAFQYLERHPWRPSLAALADPLAQAIVVTPVLLVALLAGLVTGWRRRGDAGAPWDVLAACAGGLIVAYAGLGLVADAERTRFHWLLPAWLLLLPALPSVLADWRAAGGVSRLAARVALPLGACGSLALALLVVATTRPPPGADAPPSRAMIDNLAEWPAVVAFAQAQRAGEAGAALIAGDFMLGAQLEFALGEPVAVLPHPRNARHGRAGQLSILGRDLAALEARGWREGLLLVEDTARREIDRLPALLELCRIFGGVRWRDELVLHGGRFRVLAFEVTRRDGPPADEGRACDLPPLGDFDAAMPDRVPIDRPFVVEGWAIDEFDGAAQVEVLIGDRVVGRSILDRPFPGVLGQWPMSTDPRHPDVGFRVEFDPLAAGIAAGRHRLMLRAVERGGQGRVVTIRELTLTAR